MNLVITELFIGNASLGLLVHINNVFATCEPPSCSYPELWRPDESATELEENEYGCTSVIERERGLAKFTADMQHLIITENVHAWTLSWKAWKASSVGKYTDMSESLSRTFPSEEMKKKFDLQ